MGVTNEDERLVLCNDEMLDWFVNSLQIRLLNDGF